MDNSYFTEIQIQQYLNKYYPNLSSQQHYIDIMKNITITELEQLPPHIKNNPQYFKECLDEKIVNIQKKKQIQKPCYKLQNDYLCNYDQLNYDEQNYDQQNYGQQNYGQQNYRQSQKEVQATELAYRLKLLQSRITEHHKRVKDTIKDINMILKSGQNPKEEINELVLLINISRGMYKPSNFPKGYFDKLLENPREDLTKILKENKENPLMIEYLKLYETLLKKGKLSQDIPLPYDTNKKITNQHLQEVSSKLISGMVREDHREQYYKNDPFAGPNAFTEQFDKEKSNQFVKKQRQNKDDKMDWT